MSAPLKLLDLFSGVGGFSLGLERTNGFQTIGFCENNPKAQMVLRNHWPSVPIHDDVVTIEFHEGHADVVSAGFPCQDISNAGARAGLSGERSGLYREALRAVRVVRPRYVVLENVAALLGRGVGTILGDLAALGYDSEYDCVRARDIGAPHGRDRIWILAYPHSEGRPRLVTSADFSAAGSWGWSGQEDLQLIANAPFERTNRWPKPLLRRMDDGLSGRMDRLHGVGNAILPQIAEIIGNAILRAEAA